MGSYREVGIEAVRQHGMSLPITAGATSRKLVTVAGKQLVAPAPPSVSRYLNQPTPKLDDFTRIRTCALSAQRSRLVM